MDKRNCLYHPTSPAHFECHECGNGFCRRCISKREAASLAHARAQVSYFCPRCNVPADAVAVGRLVTPFWKRLPRFFSYPLKRQPLLLNLVLALVSLALSHSAIGRIIMWAVLVKYSYAVLTATARGNLEPPELSVGLITDNFFQVFKQYMLFFILSGGGAVVAGFWGPAFLLVYALACIVFLPAMIMVLVTSDNLINALNPQYTIKILAAVGGRYFQMLLFLAMLMGAPASVAMLAFRFLPGPAAFLISSLASNYYTIVTYNLMGYILLQYHEELGYEIEYGEYREQNPLAETGKEKGPYDDLIDEVNVLVAEDRLEEAIEAIESATGGNIDDLDLSCRYYGLLKACKRSRDMLAHAARHIELLTRKSERKKACDAYRECLAIDPDFSPPSMSLFRLGGWLPEFGADKLAVNCYVRFIKKAPESQLVPEAYFNIARLLLDKLNDPARASGVLKTLVERFPGHEITIDARRCLEQITA